MSLYISQQAYLCTNIDEGCSHATRHALVFGERKAEILCPECNVPLQRTDKTKFNSVLIASSICCLCLLLIAGLFLKPVIMPESIQGVGFKQSISRVLETDAVIGVTLTLPHPATVRHVIKYHMVAGTANANEDFNAAAGQVIVLPGQQTATISIAIIPDRDQLEASETFDLILSNVEGQPRHTVIIEEVGVNKSLLEMSEVIVADLSVLAADLANGYATIKMLENYLKNTQKPDQSIEIRYDQAKSTINRVKERYLLQFNNAQELDPVVIEASIKNRLAATKRDGAMLQFQATELMRQQLLEYSDTHIPHTEVWLEELGKLVIPSDGNKTSKKLISSGSI